MADSSSADTVDTADTAAPRRTVYLDHAASSWPKPPEVVSAVEGALRDLGGNPGRGAYRMALDAARTIHSARNNVAALLGVPDSHDLLFQPGCTQAMNLMLFGLIGPGDRVVACPTEHNAVARPLNLLASRGVEVVLAEADEFGHVDLDSVESLVAVARTRAVVCQHASNVSGAIHPVADLADIAHERDSLLLVDGAQAGGHLPVDLGTLGADAWACSGHKGLLGPQGTGVLYLAPTCEPAELVVGGTGAGESENPRQPRVRPDRYEAGTPNTPGIAGLGAAARWLAEHGDEQRAREAALTDALVRGIAKMDGFRLLGPRVGEPRIPVVSTVHERIPADRLAHALDRRYGVAVRSGLHCAPWAHDVLGTVSQGAVRFSLGYATTQDDIEVVLGALLELVSA
jgi:cysteine desulfurase family protein